MPTFSEISKHFTKHNLFLSFILTIDSAIKNEIIKTITNRLFLSGKDGNQKKMRTNKGNFFYSNYTKFLKEQKGQPIDRVTLKDTGKFYDSYGVVTSDTGYEINANFTTGDNHIFWNFSAFYTKMEFEKALTKLTDFEQELLLKYLIPKIVENLRKLIK